MTSFEIKNCTLTCNPVGAEDPCDKTASEYLQEKCVQHIKNGKTTWTIDSISGESFSFSQLEELSRNVASAFHKRGMKKGDIVVYMCYDIVKLHIFFNGIWRANGVPRSLYPEELEDSILRTVVEAEAKWIYCGKSEAPLCLAVANKVTWPLEVIITERDVVDGCTSIYELFEDDGSECPVLETNADDPAIILCTSGTTGLSKGAVHSHKSVVRQCQAMEFTFPLAGNVLFMCKAAHISGSLMALTALSRGKTIITLSALNLENVFLAFDKYKPRTIYGFPSYIISLATDSRTRSMDKSSVEYIMSGGTNLKSTLEMDLKKTFLNLKHFIVVYGLTETVPVTVSSYKPDAISPHKQHDGIPGGSIGKVADIASVQVRDETGTKCLGPNEQGELCVKNSMMFMYYYKQEEETRKAFTSDGWFRTGDIGYYDENGFIYFSGRGKEMFKCSGNHVYPAHIDEVISRHPAVADVCTIAVDDPEGEKMPRAFVVLKPEFTTTADEIKDFAHKLLPTYKYLRGGVYIVPSLPKGSSGKVTRYLASQIPIPD